MFENEVVEEVTETPEQLEVEEAPEPTKEQIALEWLKEQGIEEFDANKVKNLTEFEREVNKRSSDLGRIAKELEAAREATPAKVEPDGFDDDTKAEMLKLLKAVGVDVDSLKGSIALATTTVDEAREETFASFLEAHTDVTPDEVMRELLEGGVDPRQLTPAQLKRELGKAHKVIAAAKLDPEAIKKQAIADYLADLEKKGVKPDDITEVKKGRGSASGGHRSLDDALDDSSLSVFDKWTAVASQM